MTQQKEEEEEKKNRKLKLVKLQDDIKKGRVCRSDWQVWKKRGGWKKTHQNRAKRVQFKKKVKVCCVCVCTRVPFMNSFFFLLASPPHPPFGQSSPAFFYLHRDIKISSRGGEREKVPFFFFFSFNQKGLKMMRWRLHLPEWPHHTVPLCYK